MLLMELRTLANQPHVVHVEDCDDGWFTQGLSYMAWVQDLEMYNSYALSVFRMETNYLIEAARDIPVLCSSVVIYSVVKALVAEGTLSWILYSILYQTCIYYQSEMLASYVQHHTMCNIKMFRQRCYHHTFCRSVGDISAWCVDDSVWRDVLWPNCWCGLQAARIWSCCWALHQCMVRDTHCIYWSSLGPPPYMSNVWYMMYVLRASLPPVFQYLQYVMSVSILQVIAQTRGGECPGMRLLGPTWLFLHS